MTASRQSRALAIKLSRDRRSGKAVPPPPKGKYSERTRQRALKDIADGRRPKTGRRRRKTAAQKKRESGKPARNVRAGRSPASRK
jgi:hypothetical protein